MIIHRIAACLALLAQSPAPAQGQPQEPADAVGAAQREADVHNFVAMRLRLIKRGAAVEEIKSEIVNQIDFGTLTPRSVEFLRRTMALCDKVITSQAAVSAQIAATDLQQKQEDKQAASGLAKLFLAGTGAGLPALLSAITDLDGGGAAGAARAKILAQSAASTGAEISTMEFDLAILRSQVQSDGNLPASEFVTSADYDTFLAASKVPTENDRVAAIAKALEGSPRLEPAALHLAAYFYEAKDTPNCLRYADAVIAAAPRIFRRDPIRAQARAYKAYLALQRRDFPAAVAEADAGIQDDPSSPVLIKAKAEGLCLSGDHHASLPLFEKLALLLPGDGSIRYNLACCQAVASKDVDAALLSLQTALKCGFTDIAHAMQDVDLGLLREKKADDFQALTQVRVALHLRPSRDFLSTSDVLTITNESAFTLLELDLNLTYVGTRESKQPSKPTSFVQSIHINRLEPGAVLTSRDVGQPLRAGLVELRLVASGPQGRCEKTFSRSDLQ